jgi:Flp pilus assembly protein TadD
VKQAAKAIAVIMFATLPLAGCNTTATSSHTPLSDSTGTTGDTSADVLQLGKEQFVEQNYGLSEKYFRQAVELRTDNASAWAGLAASYDQLGNFEFADRAYKQLVALKGNDPRVLNNMGYSFLLRGDYKKARTYFNRAQTADPTLDQVQGNLHLLNKVSNS